MSSSSSRKRKSTSPQRYPASRSDRYDPEEDGELSDDDDDSPMNGEFLKDLKDSSSNGANKKHKKHKRKSAEKEKKKDKKKDRKKDKDDKENENEDKNKERERKKRKDKEKEKEKEKKEKEKLKEKKEREKLKEKKEKEKLKEKETKEKERKEKERKEKERKEKESRKYQSRSRSRSRSSSESSRSPSRSRRGASKSPSRSRRDTRDRGRRDRPRDRDRGRDRRGTDRGRDRDRRGGRDHRDTRRRDGRSDRDRRGRRRSKSKEAERKKTPQEIAAEKAEEAAYRKRVQEQLDQMNGGDSEDEPEEEEELADQRRERRAARLAALQANKPAVPAPSDAELAAAKVHAEAEEKSEAERIEMEHRHKERRKLEEARANEGQEVPENVEDDDDEFDIFNPKADIKRSAKKTTSGTGESTMLDTWDDHEGYYRFRLGDLLMNRYYVYKDQGKGVFSTVFRVRDTAYSNRELVVKVIRNNETMEKAGMQELEFLQRLAKNDPDNKKHVIRLESHFQHRDHLCMVFEPMHMNLRELVKKLGGVGLNIRAVRSFAKQMLTALKHIKKCNIVHGDIKPDNILVSEQMNHVKICDLGSAGEADKCEITPYLVSRFYRAPEIIMGCAYDEQVDVWSIACVLYELYTGHILFKGSDNNGMLFRHQELKGSFTNKMVKRAQFAKQYFDGDYKFLHKKTDKYTGSLLTNRIKILRPTKNLGSMMREHSAEGLSTSEHARLDQFSDLLLKMLTLDPNKRITVEQALQHTFIKTVD